VKEITWAAGKYIYPRGSTLLTHFMPLQEFSLEKSLNYSLLIALRMARLEKHEALLSKIEIDMWRRILLTDEFVEMVKASKFIKPRFHDFGSDTALMFEELKQAKAEINNFEYVIHLKDKSYEERLSILHPKRDGEYEVVSGEQMASSLCKRSVVLVNSILGTRPQHECPPPLESIVLDQCQGCILALRVCDQKEGVIRTTIHGDDVLIPNIKSVWDWMGSLNRKWYWKWMPRHDFEFFLPENKASDVGVILAYTSPNAIERNGFCLLNLAETRRNKTVLK
jgi:hypothetical protein